MAKYNITHFCGHTQEHRICGTNVHGERDRKIEWLTGNICGECYKAEMVLRTIEANKQWPELIGSEKQIAWAMRIRANIYPKLMEIASQAEKDLGKGRKLMETNRESLIKKYGDDAIEKLEAELIRKHGRGIRAMDETKKRMTSAKWWIESFGNDSSPMLFIRKY